MIWFIIPVVVFVVVWAWAYFDARKEWLAAGGRDQKYPYYSHRYKEEPEVVECFLIGLVSAVIFLVVGLIGLFVSQDLVKQKVVTVYSADLQNIQQGSSVSGSFFLGSGTFETQPAFYYYTRNGNTYTLNHVESDGAVIVEDASVTPHVECHRQESTNRWLAPFSEGYDQYVFYVPPGSVVQNYKLGG